MPKMFFFPAVMEIIVVTDSNLLCNKPYFDNFEGLLIGSHSLSMENLQVEIKKIQTPRQARRVEQILRRKHGITSASAAAPGALQIKWDADKTSKVAVLEDIKKSGLEIVHTKSENEERVHHDYEQGYIPSYLRFLGENTELYFAIISGACWVSGLILGFISGIPANVQMTLYLSLIHI